MTGDSTTEAPFQQDLMTLATSWSRSSRASGVDWFKRLESSTTLEFVGGLSMSPKQFIEQVLMHEIGDVIPEHPYLAFALITSTPPRRG